jgi:hypothetical protein
MVMLLQVLKLPTRFSESAVETFCVDGVTVHFWDFSNKSPRCFISLTEKHEKSKPHEQGLVG